MKKEKILNEYRKIQIFYRESQTNMKLFLDGKHLEYTMGYLIFGLYLSTVEQLKKNNNNCSNIV